MKTIDFEKKLGYEFSDRALLERALTHSSFAGECSEKQGDNERLEFLGDAFLDTVISVIIYKRLESASEGNMSKTRAIIVCEHTLADIARNLSLGEYINLGRGEEIAGGRNKNSILADAMEAVIGAIYLDGCFEDVKRVIETHFAQTIDRAISGELFLDYKSQLQELLQTKGKVVNIHYITDREEGPDHDKVFYVHMVCDGKEYGRGSGKTKKEAEQNAAKESIEILERRG